MTGVLSNISGILLGIPMTLRISFEHVTCPQEPRRTEAFGGWWRPIGRIKVFEGTSLRQILEVRMTCTWHLEVSAVSGPDPIFLPHACRPDLHAKMFRESPFGLDTMGCVMNGGPISPFLNGDELSCGGPVLPFQFHHSKSQFAPWILLGRLYYGSAEWLTFSSPQFFEWTNNSYPGSHLLEL